MGIVIVDGKEVEVGDNERLNGIQAAQRAGVEIPHYCWHSGLSVVASCRMCLVETGTRNAETGEVAMVPKLVPACQTPARDGTVIVTSSEKVQNSRAMVEEDLLIDHPIDCPICDKAGECNLQDYHFKHGRRERRADIRPFTSRRRDVGDRITLFVDRCVMCTRCVRFCREVSGSSELMVSNRGAHEEIDIFEGFPLANKLSGNVVDLCPVGALGDKDFLYQQRVWFMKRHEGVCTNCSTGCSINVEENQDQVYRLKPRENMFVNKWWMCDEGRYGFHHVHSPERLTEPTRRSGSQQHPLDWSTLPGELKDALASQQSLAGVVSPHLTVEEAYLLCKLLRELDPQARLVLGPVPVRGEDEQFPGGFIIHAEKCPNRRGVEEILRHFTGKVETLDDLLADLDGIGGVWVSGGYHPLGEDEPDWIDQATAQRLAQVAVLIVQDMFNTPLAERATFLLPGAAFAERDGCYVNYSHRLQRAHWAIRPPAGVRTDGSLLWQLLSGEGMYRSPVVLAEVAAEIPYFAAAAAGVPAVGVQLETEEQPAETEQPANK